MSGFLDGLLDQARGDLSRKRAAGALYGKSAALKTTTEKKAKWLSDTKPVGARNTRTQRGAKSSTSGLSDYDLERSRKALERKEQQYKKMFNRGADMSLQGEAADNLLIDFDRKWAEGHRQESSDEDADARLASDDEFDPIIEVEDEFGRARKIRKSEALRHEKPEIQQMRPANLIYGRHLQSFNPDAKRKDEIWAEEEASKEVHYDPKFEVRQRGAGYIHLGRGQDRQERMADLSQSHTETIKIRNKHGLVEPEPPSLITVPPEPLEDVDGEDYIHPSRRHAVPRTKVETTSQEAARDAARIKAGEAFLDSIM